MVDWNALFQTIVASGAVATAVGIVFKKYTETRIEHVFDKKLKEYEARLKETTEVRIAIGKARIDEYKGLIGVVQSVRKQAVDLAAKLDPTAEEISGLRSRVKELQEMIYSLSGTLSLDRIYERLHSYKVELDTLTKNIENESKIRVNGQTERADGVRGIVDRSISDIQSECKSIVALLVDLIPPK